MLRKLIKYDLKSMSKIMIPLWIVTIVISILLRIELQLRDIRLDNIQLVVILTMIVLFGVSVAIMVMNIIFVIQRFWDGLLKNEGYLMFTLPVSTRKLILSKAISGVIVTFGSIITICIVVALISSFYLADILSLADYKISLTFNVVVRCITFVFDLISSIYFAYAAMAIGQLSNRNRFLCAFGAYLGLHVIQTIIIAVGDALIPDSISRIVFSVILLLAVIVQIVILHVITEFILTKKLNLE